MIGKEDYEETACPFCTPDKKETVPVGRVFEKLDEYFYKKDFSGAERHLKYWLSEAENLKDKRGKVAILNELVGFYRKTENEENALKYADLAIETAKDCGLKETVTMGTTLLNSATVYKAFFKSEKAIKLYEEAQKLYEKYLPENDGRFAGLYNNTALCYTDLKEYQKAKEYYFKALKILEKQKNGQTDEAITYCNLADLVYLTVGEQDGKAEINGHIEKAINLFESAEIKDGYYAYALEKCIPVFDYYGFKEKADEFSKVVKSIYERD